MIPTFSELTFFRTMQGFLVRKVAWASTDSQESNVSGIGSSEAWNMLRRNA